MNIHKLKPSLKGGLNLHMEGHRLEKSPPTLNVGHQIQAFLTLNEGLANSDNLYIIWAGGNDIKNKIIPTKLMPNLERHITSLAKAGAKTFLVPNFFPLAKAPLVEGIVSLFGRSLGRLGEYFELLDNGSMVHEGIEYFTDKLADTGIKFMNSQLESLLNDLESSLDLTIHRFDAYTYFHRVMKNKKHYGLRPNDSLFLYDGFHPNSRAHKLIAEEIFRSLN